MTGPAAPPAAATLELLRERLDELTTRDAERLGRRLDALRSGRRRGQRDHRSGERGAPSLDELAAQIAKAEDRLARRRTAVPVIRFPDELPVSARVDDLAAAIRKHQVVVVAGETGSGKSTQLPKLCLQLGRGVRGMIGHTQPRRIAARALAERIAEETGTAVGGAVGYTIRFGDHTGPDTLVKLMTDGILLAEIHRDPLLLAYDTIIVDEAHERSLNVDFLLGYLRSLLPRRPDLKLIITSATIDPGKFARHFDDAPVVEVSGRTYPVEVRYRPFGQDDELTDDPDELDGGEVGRRRPAPRANERPPTRSSPATDQAQAICAAVDELGAARDGDILVFLSGEREITDTAEVLRGHLAGRVRPPEVVPLYGRLSAADQHKVFQPHSGPRVVLATNVAETSLTVPGIKYVIDPGTARISRYSPRTKVQRLPIERISQASAAQRAGRCGRVSDGICIRLYSAEDFESRPAFTDPEIVRTALASVILQMAALNLGDIATFGFLDPPDRRQITDGLTVLTELGALDTAALDGSVRLTEIGRSLAALPIDPRLARMIVEGDRLGCLDEVLVIAAAMAIVDVREYPLEEREKATAAHNRFRDPNSDFTAFLALWRYLEEQADRLSGNAFRRMCRAEYLHYLRIREWQDLHGQLRTLVRGLGPKNGDGDGVWTRGRGRGAGRDRGRGRRDAPAAASSGPAAPAAPATGPAVASASGTASPPAPASGPPASPASANQPAAAQAGRGALAVQVDNERLHTALLAGLLSHIGTRIEASREYQGTRGTRFTLWPGSALARSSAPLVVAAELVETTRLWGRLVARVDPAWVERVGGDLLRRSYSEPRWSSSRAAVVATEKVTLLGVTLVAARTVQFDRIDAEVSRELFIRHALVEGDWQTRHRFFAQNQEALQRVSELEDRVRRRDIALDDDALYALYDERIPPEVTSGRHFDSWWKQESRRRPELLDFTPEMLTAVGAEGVDPRAFPDAVRAGDVELGVDYVFEPGRADDGVTVTVPLAVLARLDPGAFASQIPGLRDDFVVALIRTLPKTLRRNFVPAPDFARAAIHAMAQQDAAHRQAAQQHQEAQQHAGQQDVAQQDAVQQDVAAGSLPARLAAALTGITGTVVRADDFDLAKVPDHLRLTFAVVDEQGQQVAASKDLPALQRTLRADARRAVAAVGAAVERTGLTEFPADGIPQMITGTVDGAEVRGYPALVDEGRTVGITVFTSARDQQRAMRGGTRRLIVVGARSPLAMLRSSLTRNQLLTFAATPHGSVSELVSDALEASVDALLDWGGGPSFDGAGFAALRARVDGQLHRAVLDVMVAAEVALRAAHAASAAIDALAPDGGPGPPALVEQIADLRAELAAATAPGFLTRTGAAQLPDLDRYLQALAIRARRLRENPDRDRSRMNEIRSLHRERDDAVAALPAERRADPDVRTVDRLLAEYRVALFAQPLRTAVPVSAKRIRGAIAALGA